MKTIIIIILLSLAFLCSCGHPKTSLYKVFNETTGRVQIITLPWGYNLYDEVKDNNYDYMILDIY